MKAPALIIFARKPTPGKVKTRLANAIGPVAAAALYERMLQDTMAKAMRLSGVEPVLFVAGDPAWFTERFPGVPVFPQSGGDLGERMAGAFAHVFSAAAPRACIIGTDSPDLPPAYLERAFAALGEGADLVFGPADDGGYYLLGMNRLHGELFRGMAWSTEEVLQESLRRATESGLRAELLPRWYDVDLPGDLERPALVAGENGAAGTGAFLREYRGERPPR